MADGEDWEWACRDMQRRYSSEYVVLMNHTLDDFEINCDLFHMYTPGAQCINDPGCAPVTCVKMRSFYRTFYYTAKTMNCSLMKLTQ